MPAVMETPWITVHLDAHAPLIRYTRTAEPYPSLRELERLHEEAARALDRLGRQRHSLLVDMRASPMNNDPGFERSAARAKDLLVRGFPRVAVLVRTAVGSLQINRHIREGGHDIAVFNDEVPAIAYLLRDGVGTPSERPPPRSNRPGDEAPPNSASVETVPGSSRRGPSQREPGVRSRR
jgi:hypothetical protein